MTPYEAAHAKRAPIFALERHGERTRLREAIGVFGGADDAYILTTSGHIPLARGDRIVIRGTFKMGEDVPGGGVVGRGFDPGVFVTGTTFAVGGIGLVGCAIVEADAAAAARSSSFSVLGHTLVSLGYLWGSTVALTAGSLFIVFSFRQPKVLQKER